MIFLYFLLLGMTFYKHRLLDAGEGMFTAVKAAGLAGLFCAMAYTAKRGVPDYLGTRQAKLFFAMVVMAVLSFLHYGRPPQLEIGSPVVIYGSMVVFFLVIVTLVDTPTKLLRCLLTAMASIAFASLYLLREYQVYHSQFANYRPPGKVVGDANYYSLAAMLALPIGFSWFMAEKRKLYRWLLFIFMVPTSLGIAVSGSRGGVLALATFVAFTILHSRRPIRNAVVLGVLLLPPMLLIPRNPIVRLLKPDLGDNLGKEARIVTWKAGLRMVEDYPIGGIGLGEFKPMMGRYTGNRSMTKLAHNTYLELAAEMGIACLFLYLWMLLETYRSFDRARRIAKHVQAPLLQNIALGMQGGLVAYLVSSFFLSAEYVKFFWFYIFFSIVLLDITRNLARQQQAAATRLPA